MAKWFVVSLILALGAVGNVAVAEEATVNLKENYIKLEELAGVPAEKALLVKPIESSAIQKETVSTKGASLRNRVQCTVQSRYRMCF